MTQAEMMQVSTAQASTAQALAANGASADEFVDTNVYFYMPPTDTNYVNRILEGYEYLGVMTTIDPKSGLTMIRSTADTAPVVRELLMSLDVPVRFVDGPDGE